MARIQIPKIPWYEITPEEVFLNRRNFMKGAGLTLGTAALAACRMPETEEVASDGDAAGAQPETAPADLGATDELGDPLNTFEQITNYNKLLRVLHRQAGGGPSVRRLLHLPLDG